MSDSRLETLYWAGSVRRYHTERMIGPDQTVAAHSWGVALLVAHLWPDVSTQLMRAALMHDLPEYQTGDGAFTAKRRWPELKAALDRAEADVIADLGLQDVFQLSDQDRRRLKIADKLEMILHISEQRRLGNHNTSLQLYELCSELINDDEVPVEAQSLAVRVIREEHMRRKGTIHAR